MRANILVLIMVSLTACSWTGNAKNRSLSIDEDFVKKSSAQVESKIVPLIKSRFDELVTKTPDTRTKSFSKGELFLNKEGLVWKDLAGAEQLLATNKGLDEGHSISGYMISPDASKVAYYTTFQGQDLKHWSVVTLSKSPKVLLVEPVLNRMQGFSWDKNSTGIYYSFFNEKKAVKLGHKPIIESRYRDLKTQGDELVFDHGLAENFEIVDINGGEVIAAYRILNPGAGIKTTFSMYKGIRQSGGKYKWSKVYPRNKYVAVYLGRLGDKVYIQSSEAGDTYGIVEIDVLKERRRVVVPARKMQVLHTAEVIDGKVILQYHSIPEQVVSLEVMDLKNKKASRVTLIGKEFGLTPFGNLARFQFVSGGKTARATYGDVYKGNQVLEMTLKTGRVKLLKNTKDINFDETKVTQKLIQFEAKDGTKLSGRLYTLDGKAPKFAFIRYYGWISIKNSPESREVQMALELGGAYLSIDLPGGGERGADWFIKGSRNRLEMIGYISESSDYLQKTLKLGPEQVVAMGRSWGGLTSLVLAAKHGANFGIINPVVPVIDLKDMFANGWFGRIAQSDFAPKVDKDGNYILDKNFDNYIESISPVNLVSETPKTAKIHLFTNGLDDRVDQGGEQEAMFALSLKEQVAGGNFEYHRSIKGNHSNRFYQVLMFSLIADHYGLSYTPLLK